MTRAFVLHLDLREPGAPDPDAALSEAVSLAGAIQLEIVDADVAPVPKPNPSTLLGPGKVEALTGRFAAAEIDVVIV
ncbi:MAG: GTPase HflX, partial [Pseudomonadota bacterium]